MQGLVHGVVPGDGLAPDGKSWIACRPGFFLSVRVLSRLFRRRFLEELLRVHQAGKLRFFGKHAALADDQAFKAWLAPAHRCAWVVFAKRPFAGPHAMLAYLSRYTHRETISNSRLIALDEHGPFRNAAAEQRRPRPTRSALVRVARRHYARERTDS